MTDVNGNSGGYISHIQKIFEEYEQLQLEYSRLRQQLNDQVILPKNDGHLSNENNNRTADDIRAELESEKTLTKSLKNEVAYLLDQVRKTQKRYNDLVSIVKNERDKLPDYKADDKNENNSKISQLETENRELKDNSDFLSSENAILADSVKDLEETLLKERMEWIKEREEYEKVVAHSHQLYVASNANKTKIEHLQNQINNMDNFSHFIQNLAVENKLLDDQQTLALQQNCDLERKMQLYKEMIQNLLRRNKVSEVQEKVDNENVLLKTKITELCRQTETLQANNKSIISQNDQLKNLIHNNEELDQVKLKLEISTLSTKLLEQENVYEQVKQKYSRNRKVWEENEKNLTDEIGKLDNFIGALIDTLHKLPDNLKACPEVQEIIAFTEQNEMDKSLK